MSKRLMVVDDSVFIWEEMKHIVQETDFEVVGCSKTGEQAIEMFGNLLPDVVTMDIILPGMDGIETTRRILKQWPDAKVVVVSSLAFDETMEEASSVGAAGFLFKPFTSQQVLEALNKCCNAIPEEV